MRILVWELDSYLFSAFHTYFMLIIEHHLIINSKIIIIILRFIFFFHINLFKYNSLALRLIFFIQIKPYRYLTLIDLCINPLLLFYIYSIVYCMCSGLSLITKKNLFIKNK